jgi:hypothetical protein
LKSSGNSLDEAFVVALRSKLSHTMFQTSAEAWEVIDRQITGFYDASSHLETLDYDTQLSSRRWPHKTVPQL